MMKTCSSCTTTKPLEQFTKNGGNCKQCWNQYQRAWRKKPRKSKRDVCITCKLDFCSENPKARDSSKCIKCQRIYKTNWNRTNRKGQTSCTLKLKYGIDLDTYNIMWEHQKGVCAICDQRETKKDRFGNIQVLSVDHCHSTGKVRGLLCHRCNHALGLFKENVPALCRASEYLQNRGIKYDL